MKLHHIGIATRNIDETSRLLEQFGYWGDEIKLDTEQNVYVRFLHHRFNPDLELIGGGKSYISGKPIIRKKRDMCLPFVL